jgi:hypothetical protein
MANSFAIADARILSEDGKVLARGACICQIPSKRAGRKVM